MSGQAAIGKGPRAVLAGRRAGHSRRGTDVAFLGRREADLDQVAQEGQDLGVRALPVRVDLAHTAVGVRHTSAMAHRDDGGPSPLANR